MSDNERIRPISQAATHPTVDRRVARTRRLILQATVELMQTHGVEGLTMDAVAEVAEVSRSTLYRHWPQLHDLLADGLTHLGDCVLADADVPIEADTFEACIAHKALHVGRGLRDDAYRALLTTLVAAAEHNADAAKVHDRWIAISSGGVADYVRACGAAGDLDPGWVSDLVLGPIYMNAVMLRTPMSDEQIAEHVARTLAVVAVAGASER